MGNYGNIDLEKVLFLCYNNSTMSAKIFPQVILAEL